MKRDTPSECSGCNLTERWLLHNVCMREVYRRLCTSCVLKLHSGSFCPICFQVYDSGPNNAPIERVICLRCPSITHKECVTKDVINSYICPPCANPNFTFFDTSRSGKEIDLSGSKVFLAAARIASVSMSRAAGLARVDAERKVREAMVSRKNAKEALEEVNAIVLGNEKSEKIKGKDVIMMSVEENVVVKVEGGKKKVGNNNKNNNTALAAVVMAQKQLSAEGKGGIPRLNVVVEEKEKNGSISGGTNASGNFQHAQNSVKIEGQGKLVGGGLGSEMGRQVPQPNQDSLVKSSNDGGLLLGSSNRAS